MISNVTTNRAQNTNFGAIAVNKKYAHAFTKTTSEFGSNDISFLESRLLSCRTENYGTEAYKSLNELHPLVKGTDTVYILTDTEKAEFDKKSGGILKDGTEVTFKELPPEATARRLPQYLLEKVKTAATIPDEVAEKAVAKIELAQKAARNIRKNVVDSILNGKA